MKRIIFLFIVLLSQKAFGQTTSVVKDRASNKPVPYVNIWIEDENIGTTSNENGIFTLHTSGKEKIVVFSAVGYETERIQVGSISTVVLLEPKTMLLTEVMIKPSNEKRTATIGRFKKSDIDSRLSTGLTPWILARYYPSGKSIETTPYVRKIRIFTDSGLRESKFNVRLYAANELGTPGELIHGKNILCVAKKGERIAEIDLSDLHVVMPREGLFVAVEQLIIDENRREYTSKVKGLEGQFRIVYEPAFGAILSGSDQNMWVYRQGKWSKMGHLQNEIKRYRENYFLLAMEIGLSN